VHPGPQPQPPKRVRDDARLSHELAYCVPIGLPHSEFLSWDPDDQDKALAFRALQSEYHVCGTRPEEWDPARGGSRVAYVAEVTRCLGCEEIGRARRDMPEGELGMIVGLVRNPDAG
jgi:hypothetical protein